MRINRTEFFINEINELIHLNLDKKWMATHWELLENGANENKIHPFVKSAFKAHKQINDFISLNQFSITDEIWEIAGLAIYTNALKRASVNGLENRLKQITSDNFVQYWSVRYEIQVAGMLLGKGNKVTFIEENKIKTPDIFIQNDNDRCEIECKHKEPGVDQLDYVKSIYNNTQRARKQFSKSCSGIIFIEIDKQKYNEFLQEYDRLAVEIGRAMRGSKSISGICLTSRIATEDEGDFVDRHRASIRINPNAAIPIPDVFLQGLILI